MGGIVAPANKTMIGAMVHPLIVILWMSGWKFHNICIEVFVTHLSLQYVNSINYVVNPDVGVSGGGWLYVLESIGDKIAQA